MQYFGLLIGGIILLVVGGRLLVGGAVDAATRFRISPLVVGLTLVAWGTSFPELALNLASAVKGRGDLALGNIVGANICNMALVLGAAALIHPLRVEERLIRVEIWLNAIILCFMVVVGLATGFSRLSAGSMLVVFAIYSIWTMIATVQSSRSAARVEAEVKIEQVIKPQRAPLIAWLIISSLFIGGLTLLALGGSLASDGASGIALALGVPPAIVGVTVVSIGTTLPELITSLIALQKGQSDMAMGNVVGSCLFNAGATFGITAMVAPPTVDHQFVVPMVYMALLAVALVPISRTFGKTVSRIEGALLLGSYALFLAISAWQVLAD